MTFAANGVDSLVRDFGLQDVLLVRALQSEGMFLDLEQAVLRPSSPLRTALISQIPLTPAKSYTYIVRNKQQAGFVQAQQGRGPAEAYLSCLAPSLSTNGDDAAILSELLDSLSIRLGQRGIQRIHVKLATDATAEATVFRESGFRVYTQEHVYYYSNPNGRKVSTNSIHLQPWETKHAWGVHRLYRMSAPRFVQQAEYLQGEISEAATSDWAQGKHEDRFVWIQANEVAAYLRLLTGEDGHWLHLLMHTDHTEHASALVNLGVAHLNKHSPQPIYCTIRTYELNLVSALESAGFKEYHSRFLLVKQASIPIRQKVFEPLPQVEGAETAPTASVGMNYENGIGAEPTPIQSEVLTKSQ